ncbi:MAG: AraC family transcriptional regulator [Spirochaetales bacterium]|jgi:AraC-like DNA-binding protein/mannose-6-phosphate isomerase-like protein (cupin superfamily)|nr:AraC family transcriptional regulator [Spirochaetales bacterium]
MNENFEAINCYRFQSGKYLNCDPQKKPFYNIFFFIGGNPGSFILDGNWADILAGRLFFIPPETDFSINCENSSVDCFHISFASSSPMPVRSPYFTIVTPEFRQKFIRWTIELAGSCLRLDYAQAARHVKRIMEKLAQLTAESRISFATRHVAVIMRDIPKHFHFDDYQIDYFVSGAGTYFIDNRWMEYSPGTFGFVPPRILHAIRYPQTADVDTYSVKFKLPGDSFLASIPAEAFVRQIPAERQPALLVLLKKIVGEFVMDIPVSPNRLTSLISLINEIIDPSAGNSAEDGFVTRVKNIVLAHYSRELRITEIARRMGISPEYLSRQFKKRARQTLVSYINAHRMKLGRTMLQNTNMPIKQIAADCGFKNVNYFTTMFKLHFSVTPKTIRKHAKNTADAVREKNFSGEKNAAQRIG